MASVDKTIWRGGPARGGFTLLELMVVIVIIGLLITLVSLAFAGAFSTGKRAATQQYLRNIALGLEQFKNDFNYYPPLIDEHKHAPEQLASQAEVQTELAENRFNSIFTLPLYIVGVGDLAPVNHAVALPNPDIDDGKQGPGIRDPGPDHSWGGAADRMKHRPTMTGRVYGPYMDVGSGKSFHEIQQEDIAKNHTDPAQVSAIAALVKGLYVFEDRWDTPIRYYRSFPVRDHDDPTKFSLDRIPIELIGAETIGAKTPGAELNAGMERDLLSAPFALLSAGEDEVFATSKAAPAPADPQPFGFAQESILPMFRNSAKIEALLVPDLKALMKSVENNVRVLP